MKNNHSVDINNKLDFMNAKTVVQELKLKMK